MEGLLSRYWPSEGSAHSEVMLRFRIALIYGTVLVFLANRSEVVVRTTNGFNSFTVVNLSAREKNFICHEGNISDICADTDDCISVSSEALAQRGRM